MDERARRRAAAPYGWSSLQCELHVGRNRSDNVSQSRLPQYHFCGRHFFRKCEHQHFGYRSITYGNWLRKHHSVISSVHCAGLSGSDLVDIVVAGELRATSECLDIAEGHVF